MNSPWAGIRQTIGEALPHLKEEEEKKSKPPENLRGSSRKPGPPNSVLSAGGIMRKSLGSVLGLLAVHILTSMASPAKATETDDAPASPGARRSLGAVNTIVVSRPTIVPVRLENDSMIEVRLHRRRARGPNQSIELHGNGRFVGFALTSDPPEGGPILVAGRFGECFEPGCDPGRAIINYVWPPEGASQAGPEGSSRIGRYLKLPAGDYRAYFTNDQLISRMRIRIRGLHGRVTLDSRNPASIDVQSPEVHLSVSEEQSTYAAGSAFDAGSEGFFVGLLFLKSREYGDVSFGICNYAGPTAPPSEVAYGPQCTTLALAGLGAGWFATFRAEQLDSGYLILTMQSNYAPNSFPPSLDGRQGLGMWFASTGRVDLAGSQAFFVSYD